MKPKRRLPMVPSAEAEPVRPSWQWVVFGAFGIFVVWLPISALGAQVARTTGALAAASIIGLGVASVAGGLLLGRWGGPGVGVREGALAGLLASVVAFGEPSQPGALDVPRVLVALRRRRVERRWDSGIADVAGWGDARAVLS